MGAASFGVCPAPALVLNRFLTRRASKSHGNALCGKACRDGATTHTGNDRAGDGLGTVSTSCKACALSYSLIAHATDAEISLLSRDAEKRTKPISHGAEVEMDFGHVECTDDKVVAALSGYART